MTTFCLNFSGRSKHLTGNASPLILNTSGSEMLISLLD